MSDYLPLLFAMLAIYVFAAGRRFGHLSAISLFVYAQAVMAVGVLPSLVPTLRADLVHASLILWTFAAITGTAVAYSALTMRSSRRSYAPVVSYGYNRTSVWAIIVISLIICALYYASIGYIAFFESLRSLSSGAEQDIAGLRLESYAGARYLFPGYVNLFKNALLPALVLVVLAYAYHYRTQGRHLVTILLVPATLVFLLGTGQRAPLVRTLAFVAITLYLVAPKDMARHAPRISLIGLPLFFLATFATGRAAQELARAEGAGGVITVFFNQLLFRIFGSSQLGAVVGFRWVYEQEQIPFGSEWAQGLVGLLPGQKGPDTANQIFALLYGSTRGTAPLSLWGSAYYNFGMVGALVIAVAIALVLSKLSHSVASLPAINVLEATGLAGMSMTFGLWISDGPTTPLNAGLPAFLFLWLWGRAAERRRGRPKSGARAHVVERPLAHAVGPGGS